MSSSQNKNETNEEVVGNDSDTHEQATQSQEGKTKENRIIKRFGGRHLIFRTKLGGWWMIPKPYILISSFRGAVWVFYGMGQIWATHTKDRQIEDWIVRKPRIRSKAVTAILDRIEPEVREFVNYCNGQSIEGTLVLERKMIEFHWTFGNEPLPKEKEKPENAETLDSKFNLLVDAFLKAKDELGL